MDKARKKEILKASRPSLEAELYQAELDLKLAQESRHEELATEPKARVEEIKSKIGVLDKEEAKLK